MNPEKELLWSLWVKAPILGAWPLWVADAKASVEGSGV